MPPTPLKLLLAAALCLTANSCATRPVPSPPPQTLIPPATVHKVERVLEVIAGSEQNFRLHVILDSGAGDDSSKAYASLEGFRNHLSQKSSVYLVAHPRLHMYSWDPSTHRLTPCPIGAELSLTITVDTSPSARQKASTTSIEVLAYDVGRFDFEVYEGKPKIIFGGNEPWDPIRPPAFWARLTHPSLW